MKKVIMVLVLATVVLSLAACNRTAENQDLPILPTETEQETVGASGGNADTNANPNTNEQSLPQEQLGGVIQAIDGMKLTIDTSQVFMSFGGEQRVEPGAPVEKQDAIVRLAEQTVIEVRTTAGGQITSTRAGTLDDLSLQAIVIADGEWQGNEFVATVLIIVNPASNANQNVDPSASPNPTASPSTSDNPNTNQNTNEQSLPQEQLAGTIQAIDGMKLTIDTSQVFMSLGGEQRVEPGAPVEKQETSIRLTEQTAIEVRASAGGQITGTRAGALDDLSLQNIVLVEGEWQGDEFVATALVIFKM